MPILEWLNKNEASKAAERLPFRLMDEQGEYSYGSDDNQNMMIQGDNLDALKSLVPSFGGRIKCVYIDPPYNTGNAFEHYDDGIEHSLWLSLLKPRLELLHRLLAEDGTIWISIDDAEGHYLKVLCDEVFGRKCFVSTVIWRSTDNSNNDAKKFSVDHNMLLVYSKSPDWKSKRLMPLDIKRKHFKNPDNDPRGAYFDGNPISSPNPRPNLCYDIIAPQGNAIKPPRYGWRWSKDRMQEMISTGEIWFTKDGQSIRRRTYLADQGGLPPSTLWADLEETGHNRQAKYEQKQLFQDWSKDEWFSTPKPEKLIKKIIDLCSDEGDYVLDSFLGSGTTAAVAHKMNRKWIGIEMGEHAITHCVPRLKKVVDGEQGGISESVKWKGGGGFRFYKLGEQIFQPDGTINPKVKFKTLATHIWFSETGTPLKKVPKNPLLGINNGVAYYLLFNGILGDKRPDGGNVLTSAVLRLLPKHSGVKMIFGETTRLSAEYLKRLNIVFKQIPYDVRAH